MKLRFTSRPGAHALVVELERLPGGVLGMAIWPVVFLRQGAGERALSHELVHIRQQERWLVRGLGVGLPLWWLLYLLALPVGWNPWRWRWEAEAYRQDGYGEEQLAAILRGSPYLLWWGRAPSAGRRSSGPRPPAKG